MYCPTCGTRNDDLVRFCGNCGRKLQEDAPILPPPDPQPAGPPPDPGPKPEYHPFREQSAQPQRVPDYLAQAILVTLFCCVPFGIVSIVYAARVSGKVAMGDMEGALRTSRSARNWAWASFGVGLALNIIVLIFFAVTTLSVE